jgi:CubicO group peptidase (beta-lactamase class C family)
MPANLDAADLLSFTRELADPRAERIRFVGLALAAGPVGPAERTFTYSNNGYVTAAVMLEQALGQSWETLIRTHLFAPLKLSSAGIGAPGRAGVLVQPVGHAPGATAPVQPYPVGEPVTDNPAVFGPTGRVHMSMADLTTYLAAHRDRTALLKPETWAVLHTPPFGGDYAMGWVVRQGGKLWHNGTNTLWYAEVLVDAADGKVAAAAANDGRPSAIGPVGQALAGALAAV